MFPGGALLSGSGSSSIAADDLVLSVTATANSFGFLIAGSDQAAGGNGIVVSDGLICVGGQVVRLTQALLATNNSSTIPQTLAVVDTAAQAGLTRNYQYWFRSVGPCGQGANFTNGYSVTWVP